MGVGSFIYQLVKVYPSITTFITIKVIFYENL